MPRHEAWHAYKTPGDPGADAAQAAERRCLSCGAAFPSTHTGNRICGYCKTGRTYRSGVTRLEGNCGGSARPYGFVTRIGDDW